MNLSNVTELSIGLERSGAVGGKGVIYFDDIRLYAYDRQLVTPTEPDTASLVAHYDSPLLTICHISCFFVWPNRKKLPKTLAATYLSL